MISDYDGNWYPEFADDYIHKTSLNIITQREWAKKKALEMLAGTEAGKKMVSMMRASKKK